MDLAYLFGDARALGRVLRHLRTSAGTASDRASTAMIGASLNPLTVR